MVVGSSLTPMGSTTKLVNDPNKGGGCWFCPSFSRVLAALSLAFSLGNVLRLPRLAVIHGGGTFLAIYAGITILFGIPLAFLEIVLGQFCQQGTTKLWRAVPLLKGVGYVKVVCSLMLAVYYPVVMAISLFYGLWTVKGPLPFSECLQPTIGDEEPTSSLLGESCLEKTFLQPPEKDIMWFGVNVTLLFLLWAFVVLCVCRGAKSYRTSAVLLILPLVGLMSALLTLKLMESSEGLTRLFTFTWDPVFRFDTWYYAMVQFFFSTHIGFGNLTTSAGNIYSKSNAFWVAVGYILCSLAVGTGMIILVFLWIGNGIASWHQVSILFVLTQIYDTATFSKNGQIMASLAYLMIVLAGFTSMVALIYTIVVSICVETKNKWRSWLITATVCGIGFVVGIAIMLPEKLKFLHMLDHYVIGHMVAMSTALELVGFLWVYGVDTLCNDFEFVLGYKLSKFWNVVWFTTPIFLVVVEVCSLFLLPLNGEDVEDDRWVYLTGWFMYLALWFIIIFIGLWQLCSQVDYNLTQEEKLNPSIDWSSLEDESMIYDNSAGDESVKILGRRVIEISHFFRELQRFRHTDYFSCGISDVEIMKEKISGLFSSFYLMCRMCKSSVWVSTDSLEKMGPNTAAVAGALAIGVGQRQTEEFMAALDIPFMAQTTWQKLEQTEVARFVEGAALEEMLEAGKEEATIARELGEVDGEGFPLVPVITDGTWAKRSYGTKYNSLSGMKLQSSLKPTRNWGPVDPLYRHGWVQWRDSCQNTGERDFTLKRRGTRDYTHSIKSEQRYSTMSLPRPNSAYVVQLPEQYWPRGHQQPTVHHQSLQRKKQTVT